MYFSFLFAVLSLFFDNPPDFFNDHGQISCCKMSLTCTRSIEMLISNYMKICLRNSSYPCTNDIMNDINTHTRSRNVFSLYSHSFTLFSGIFLGLWRHFFFALLLLFVCVFLLFVDYYHSLSSQMKL